MIYEYKLTVAVLTMNRSEQLREAIDSCLDCKLPEKTEFVIIDNASTDNTESVVLELMAKTEYDVVYSRQEKNLGVGGGRAVAFDRARGEYVYFLDDDAIISENCRDTFFSDTVSYLDGHPRVASLTTHIHDEIFGDERMDVMTDIPCEGKLMAFFFLGGSHFLRHSCFTSPLCLNVIYGAEEYLPSIRAIDNGFFNVYDPEISIIHKPRINKWSGNSETSFDVKARAIAVPYATKRLLYPKILAPILWLGYRRRISRHIASSPSAKATAKTIVAEILKNNKQKKIKFSTVTGMYKHFGSTVF
ncbi:MAG: glycosyltransferase family 2 protein [Clostridia bacterium]|nr:glycosyltransferase family 2 protein [Clostridia bacterium]